jgi:hypothetical protein
MLVYALVSLAAGLAMILGHNVWSTGTLPVVVTLVGRLVLAKGLMLFFATPEALIQTPQRTQYGEHYCLYVAPSLTIGLYLTWAGFTARASNVKTLNQLASANARGAPTHRSGPDIGNRCCSRRLVAFEY